MFFPGSNITWLRFISICVLFTDSPAYWGKRMYPSSTKADVYVGKLELPSCMKLSDVRNLHVIAVAASTSVFCLRNFLGLCS
jgi:hypothetical protein